jgi:hypothetical protein
MRRRGEERVTTLDPKSKLSIRCALAAQALHANQGQSAARTAGLTWLLSWQLRRADACARPALAAVLPGRLPRRCVRVCVCVCVCPSTPAPPPPSLTAMLLLCVCERRGQDDHDARHQYAPGVPQAAAPPAHDEALAE